MKKAVQQKLSHYDYPNNPATIWRDDQGFAHREDDKPAFLLDTGTKEWFRHGFRHRLGDKPAIVYGGDRGREWWVEGVRHRDEDQPAVIWLKSGQKMWYKDGKVHRKGAPAIITRFTETWYHEGIEHREDGPSHTANFSGYHMMRWCLQGTLIKQRCGNKLMYFCQEQADKDGFPSHTWIPLVEYCKSFLAIT